MKDKNGKALFLLLEIVFIAATVLLVSEMPLKDIFVLGIAASFSGRAIAYTKVFEWLREPFAVVIDHPSGVGSYIECRDDLKGWRKVFGELICCPVCAGTWSALVLALAPPSVRTIMAAAGIAWFVTYLTEAIEWSKAKNWEHAGSLRNGE